MNHGNGKNGRGNGKIRVLVVDDSALVRRTLTRILSSDRELEVIGTAANPFHAARRIKLKIPDVIILDTEMPRMDGFTFLRTIMSQCPVPVVMCHRHNEDGKEISVKALKNGAADVIFKPQVGVENHFKSTRSDLISTVKAASRGRACRSKYGRNNGRTEAATDEVIIKPEILPSVRQTEKVVVMGASTGGVRAIENILTQLPVFAPGIVIVLHIGRQFVTSFSARLDRACRMAVKTAEDGDQVVPGTVLIAPGNVHTLMVRKGDRYFVELTDGPPVCGHRPSVDVLFRSAAICAGDNAVGVIMTGMGGDGARGLLDMQEAGAVTLAQDEATSVVFGMPREAIRLGAAQKILSIHDIPDAVLRECTS